MKPCYWHYWIGLLLSVALMPVMRTTPTSLQVRLEDVWHRVLDPGGAVNIRCSAVVPDWPALADITSAFYPALPARAAPNCSSATLPGSSGVDIYLDNGEWCSPLMPLPQVNSANAASSWPIRWRGFSALPSICSPVFFYCSPTTLSSFLSVTASLMTRRSVGWTRGSLGDGPFPICRTGYFGPFRFVSFTS